MKEDKKVNKKIAVICIAVIFCVVGTLLFYNANSTLKSKNEDLPVTETGDKNPPVAEMENNDSSIKEISAGFYLYDKEKNPVMNDQSVEIGADGQMEFNIECVNNCKVDLNYTFVILVNDCYQDVDYKKESDSFSGRGKIQKDSSEMINAKFTLCSYDREKNNELRMVMFYYSDDIPEDEVEQVLVGGSSGIYPITGTIADKIQHKKDLPNRKSYAIKEQEDMQAIWITENECKDIPKYDCILNLKDDKSLYFNAVGESGRYLGMVFIDGIPISINENYVFGWKQKKGNIMCCNIIDELADGENLFAYMYQQGGGLDDSYLTNLYKLEH